MLRLTNKTQDELKMYMNSWNNISEDCKYIYWSFGVLADYYRVEWWVILDYNNSIRFVEFKKDNRTKEIKQSFICYSESFKDMLDKMKTHSKTAYLLLEMQTVIV